jgi:hypothetical protein
VTELKRKNKNMLPAVLFILFGTSAVISGITAWLARDQLSSVSLIEEPRLTDLVGRDPRLLPDRLFSVKGARLKRISIICAALAIGALIAYNLSR